MNTNTNEQVFDFNNAAAYIKNSFSKFGDSFYELLLYTKKISL